MSAKISQLPFSGPCDHNDLFVAVQSGVNVKMTRDFFTIVIPGQAGGWSIGTAFVGIFPSGDAVVQAQAGHAIQINTAVGPTVLIDANGAVKITFPAGQTFQIIDGAGGAFFNLSGGAVSIAGNGAFVGSNSFGFDVSAPGNWAFGPPLSTTNDAINRLAAAVAGLLGGPIP